MSLQRIDIHHHIFPPEYLAAIDRLGLTEAGGGGVAFPDWSLSASLEMMDRRKTVVFIHPNVHSSNRQLGLEFPAALFEFLADTTRAVPNLALSGTLHRYPNIRWILSHAGAAIPSHTWRWALADRSAIVKKNAPQGVLTYLRQLYFDTALSPSPYAMRPALDLAGSKHILFGSDFPYVHGDVLDFEIQQFDQLEVFDQVTRSMVVRTNALALFPRLAQKAAAAR